MSVLSNMSAFNVGENNYSWEDIMLAAVAWGDWNVLKEEVRKGLACLKRMRCMGEHPTDQEMNSAINKFLSDHELTTVEELKEWLKQWGLDHAGWMKYICISILRKKWSEQLPEIISGFPVTDQEIDLYLNTEAVCSKTLFSVCHELAVRLSIYERQKNEAVIGGSGMSSEEKLKALLNKYNANLRKSGWIKSPFEVKSKKLETLAYIDLYYQHFCRNALTSEAIKEQIRHHNFDWIRVDFFFVSFQDDQIAREAFLCVKEDGESFNDVAVRLKSQIQKGYYYLDQVNPFLHTHFLHAQKNELIGPLDLAGRPTLFLVCNKIMPSEKDPCIKERAKESILEDIIDFELKNRVHWEPPFYRE